MVEGINSLDSINSSLNNLLSGGSNTAQNDNISGSLQGDISTLGIGLSLMKTEIGAKVAIIKAKNEVMNEVLKLGENSDIEDTAQISQSYHNRAAVLRNINQ